MVGVRKSLSLSFLRFTSLPPAAAMIDNAAAAAAAAVVATSWTVVIHGTHPNREYKTKTRYVAA